MTAAFTAQMRRMLGLRFPPADMATHFEALQRVPADVLEAAVTRAISSQSDFPTPHELLTYSDLVRGSVPVPVVDESDRRVRAAVPETFVVGGTALTPGRAVVNVRDVWRYDCEDCNDGGMVSFWCGDAQTPTPKPWWRRRTCDRREPHYAHEWVGECVCAPTNPTIQRRQAARATKFASEPAKGQR